MLSRTEFKTISTKIEQESPRTYPSRKNKEGKQALQWEHFDRKVDKETLNWSKSGSNLGALVRKATKVHTNTHQRR